MKTCTRCGVSKEESTEEFYSLGTNRAGEPRFDPRCKECRRAETRALPPLATCRECGTKLRREAATDLCGFCAPEPPYLPPPEQFTPPSATENRARVAGEQAAREPIKGR